MKTFTETFEPVVVGDLEELEVGHIQGWLRLTIHN